jgi:hypothetical protein
MRNFYIYKIRELLFGTVETTDYVDKHQYF